MRPNYLLYLKHSLLVAGLCLVGACSQPKALEWPEITKETKPWTRWWWEGSAVREGDITAQLEAFNAAGLGGVEITPIYGVRGYEDRFLEFLSPEWMKAFIFTLDEAKRLGMGVDLANASGWPFGGPWVSPEDACKNFVYKVYKLKGGESLKEAVRYTQQPLVRAIGKQVDIKTLAEPVSANKNLQEYAFDQLRYEKELPIVALTANSDKGEVIDLNGKVSKDGKLEWVAPEGNWTICALFQGDHGKMVERAGPGGEGDVIDHFSQQAIDNYLKRFDEVFPGYDVSYLRYYFNDSYEVDDAQGQSNWTPLLLEEFKTLRGYDLKEHLPALLGLDTPEKNSQVLYDYRLTINDLLLERYTKSWQAWAAKQGKGIRNQAHGSPANILDLYAASDVPEIEGRDLVTIKSASSASHVTGKKLTSSESATWLNEHFESTLGDVKRAIDLFLLGGVNHVFYHGSNFTPQDAPWPGWLFYAAVHFTPTNPFWHDFGALNAYITRAQSFLQAGKPDNDILVYYPISDVWSKTGNEMLPHIYGFERTMNNSEGRTDTEYLQSKGYAWDLISDRQIADLTASKGKLHSAGGSYKTLFFSQINTIPYETFEQAMKLAEAGATILFHNALPHDIAGYANREEHKARFEETLGKLNFAAAGNTQVAKYGKGKIVVSEDRDALLATAGVQRETLYDQGLACIRRQIPTGSYYFIVNPSKTERFEGWVPIQTPSKAMAIYDPMQVVNGYGRTRQGAAGGEEVYLQLKPGESVIVETFNSRQSGDEFAYFKEAGAKQPIVSPWEVTFTAGGPELPAPQTVTELGSWSEFGAPAYAIFSGTANYTTTLPALSGAAAWRLDLGDVRESAEVFLNGQYLGTLFQAPFVIDIDGKRLTGSDQLTVKVSNSMANRIIDLDKRGTPWKIFYNTNFPARRRENSINGEFNASKWEPFASGLMGPVSVTPLSAL